MTSQKNINNAKSKLSSLLESKNEEDLILSTTSIIRELFNDIEPLIRTKAVKTEEIYLTIKSDINNISYSSFRTILSKIRKEKGIQLRNRSNNKIKSAIKPIIKPVHNQNEIKQPTVADNGKLLDVTLSPLQRNNIDKSHYTPDDWANEWELIMDIYKSNKDLKCKYQAMGGDINDVIHLTNSLKDIRIISDKTSTLFRQHHNEYKIRSNKK